jgi:predicted transcriptional regulator
VLRAILAWSHGDYVRATQTAAMIGQGLAIAFGIWGLFQMNPFVIFIALFVYLGAQEEAYAAQMRSVFRGLPVREAMLTRFRVLSPHDTLGKAVDELLAGSQQDFPVVDNGAVVGVLLRSKLFKALTEQGRDVPVSQAMQSGCAAVSDSDMLQTTFERMRSEQCPCLPVLRNGQLVGMVTLENVGELMFIRSALGVDGARGVVEDIYRG